MSLTKEEFHAKKEQWLENVKTKKGIIAQLDADGMCSAYILNKVTGLPVVGITDLYNTIYGIGKGDNVSDYVFVDVEIFDESVYSIGNHNNITNDEVLTELLQNRLSNCLNPNYQFGVTVTDYRQKYPYSTSIYLMELFGDRFDMNEMLSNEKIKTCLIFSDGIYNNVWKYRANSEDWQKKLFTNPIINEQMLNPLFEIKDRSAYERTILDDIKRNFNNFDAKSKCDKSVETIDAFTKRKLENMSAPFTDSGFTTEVNFDKKITLDSKIYSPKFYNPIPREYHCDPILIYENTFTINYIYQDSISLTNIPTEDRYV